MTVGDSHRSIKERFSADRIYRSSTAIEVLFPRGRARTASELFVSWLREKGGTASKGDVSRFADSLHKATLRSGEVPFAYSRRNFYLTVLRTLVELGFVQRNVPVWNNSSKRTEYAYVRNIFDIPQKPPAIGFWRNSYYICKKWNELFSN